MSYSAYPTCSKELTFCYMSVIMNMGRTVFPLMVTAVLNIIIFLAIRNRSNARVALTAQNNVVSDDDRQKHKALMNNKRALKTISLIMVSITLSYLPLRIITMVSVCGSVNGLYESISNYIVLLKFLNSITNPTIYMLTTRQFKQSMKNYLHKIRLCFHTETKSETSDEKGANKISLTGSTSC